jgi:hypothetical protein
VGRRYCLERSDPFLPGHVYRGLAVELRTCSELFGNLAPEGFSVLAVASVGSLSSELESASVAPQSLHGLGPLQCPVSEWFEDRGETFASFPQSTRPVYFSAATQTLV